MVRKRAVNRWIIVGLLAGGAFLGSAALVNYLLGPGPLVGERVASASQMIMQIDSFLAAGYIVGFFQFQEDMAKRIRDAKFLIPFVGNRRHVVCMVLLGMRVRRTCEICW